MIKAEQIALWADTLRDISAMGGQFAKNPYDKENYKRIQEISIAMLAGATGEPIEHLDALRNTLLSRPTPFSVGDAAVINENGEILLIRRADNGLWAMPGGALEVGETPAEGVVREALEETGVHCEAVRFVGIFDSRYCGSATAHHMYQFLFLCRPLDRAQETPSHALETLDVQWFPENGLPDEIDPGHVSRIPEAFRVWHGDNQAYFDHTD